MIEPRYREPLIFDIECTSIKGVDEFIEPAQAPANYKDEAKIAQFIAEKRAEKIRRAALDPDLARVVCIGVDGHDGGHVAIARHDDDEARLLQWFWDQQVRHQAEQAVLIGFGILTYDLRVLVRRSLYLGVRAATVSLDRYKHPGVVDLMEILSFNGAENYHSLNFYIQRFGLGPFEPDISGDAVSACIAVGDWTTVEQHCRMDVRKTRALAERIGVLQKEAA